MSIVLTSEVVWYTITSYYTHKHFLKNTLVAALLEEPPQNLKK